jgi:hypothetical protein
LATSVIKNCPEKTTTLGFFAQSGTDVMIFKIFSPKNLAKKLAFLTQNKASFCKKCDHNIGF